MATNPKIEELRDKRAERQELGGQERIERQHKNGRGTAYERLEILLDPGTFREIDAFTKQGDGPLGDSVVTGWGTIDGRLVYVYSQDFTTFGGSLSEVHAAKIVKVMEMSMKTGAPIIGLNDSGGARIQDGVESLAGYADIFLRNTMASGVVPQISVIMGPCAGGAVYSPALTDYVIMIKETSYMFITGPNVVKQVLNEDVTFEELGGATIHASKSGIAHLTADDETQGLMLVRELLSYLPQNNMEDPPALPSSDDPLREDESLNTLIPDNPNKPYDIKTVIEIVVDDGHFFEIHEDFAANIVVGYARLGWQAVGIVDNQPMVLAGVVDITASEKAAPFILYCTSIH
ncbi:MAG: acyl-CoA carboxylase subunit beta, partial [Anaerolineae bacterium]